MPVMVDGELLEDEEVKDLLNMVNHDCKEFAGVFFENDRSEKFRNSWNDVGQQLKRSPQDCFVEHAAKHFIVHVRAWYAQKLGDPKEKPKNKERMHKALILQTMIAQAQTETEQTIQMTPGDEQFKGDRKENANINETYGKGPGDLRSRLLRTATRH